VRDGEWDHEDDDHDEMSMIGQSKAGKAEEEDENFATTTDGGADIARNFDDMGLSDDLLRGVYCMGFERPSPIQQRAVKSMIKGGDMLAQAHSGTGKTGAFALGLLGRVNPSLQNCQAIVLSPTRDLALQSGTVIKKLSEFMGIDVKICRGGTDVILDLKDLQRGVHVVCGTPGRILSHIQKGDIEMKHLQMIVLDEADELLEAGFEEQIKSIITHCSIPESTDIVCFSATMPTAVEVLTKKFLRSPSKILLKKSEQALKGIRQFYVPLPEESMKIAVLDDLYSTMSISTSIVFANSKAKVVMLARAMEAKGHSVSVIHGEMEQSERDYTLEEFRSGRSRVLIATDVLKRGIDVQAVSLVINYDLPGRMEDYMHRIGRAGRYGRHGVAINLITKHDVDDMKTLEKEYSLSIEELPEDYSHICKGGSA
jgi:superfamily II DNA/RNA helicase